jgi:hypothetical protein
VDVWSPMKHPPSPQPWPRSKAVWEASPGYVVPTCLADETAIDFPTLLRLADGARRVFASEVTEADIAGHGGAGEVFAATVHVSGRAAVAGSVVACELMLRDICGSCGGRGESWSDPCSRCASTGYVVVRRRVRLAVPAGVRDGAVYRLRLTRANQSSAKVDVRVVVSPRSF